MVATCHMLKLKGRCNIDTLIMASFIWGGQLVFWTTVFWALSSSGMDNGRDPEYYSKRGMRRMADYDLANRMLDND